MINNRFIHFETQAQYQANRNNISSNAIVFVDEGRKIYTHGKEYGGSDNSEALNDLSQRLQALQNYIQSISVGDTNLQIDRNSLLHGQILTYNANIGKWVNTPNNLVTTDTFQRITGEKYFNEQPRFYKGISINDPQDSTNFTSIYQNHDTKRLTIPSSLEANLDIYGRGFIKSGSNWMYNGGSKSDYILLADGSAIHISELISANPEDDDIVKTYGEVVFGYGDQNTIRDGKCGSRTILLTVQYKGSGEIIDRSTINGIYTDPSSDSYVGALDGDYLYFHVPTVVQDKDKILQYGIVQDGETTIEMIKLGTLSDGDVTVYRSKYPISNAGKHWYDVDIFDPDQTYCRISIDCGEHGTVKGGTQKLVTPGSSVTIEFLPDSGYALDTVKKDDANIGTIDENTVTIQNVTMSMSITATFKQTGNGGGNDQPGGNEEPETTVVTVDAHAADYKVLGGYDTDWVTTAKTYDDITLGSTIRIQVKPFDGYKVTSVVVTKGDVAEEYTVQPTTTTSGTYEITVTPYIIVTINTEQESTTPSTGGIYYGFAENSIDNITGLSAIQDKSTIAGQYTSTSEGNLHYWYIVFPNEWNETPHVEIKNGFGDVTMTALSNMTINSISYKVYRTDLPLGSGDYTFIVTNKNN